MAAGYHEVAYDDGDKYRGVADMQYLVFCLLSLPTSPGDWNAEGKRHGLGVVCAAFVFMLSSRFDCVVVQLNFVDGSVYAGQFTNGFMSGHGTLNLPDKVLHCIRCVHSLL
jgi:hypothetical protein